jgi:D-alanyl-D-alanine dipeptidase
MDTQCRCIAAFLLLSAAISARAEISIDPPAHFRQIKEGPAVAVDIRYSTQNNFTGKDLYGDFDACYLHETAALKLEEAARDLSRQHPGWKLLLFDCLRPRSVQKILWNEVKGTAQEPYIADPSSGSVHNYGYAVDLSLIDDKGRELDMGTPYDTFDILSRPTQERTFLKNGKLTRKQVHNRKILRKVMTHAGFIQLPDEWWHYDALPPDSVKNKLPIIE